eukprot:174332-Prymnesium_polylepis.1
MLWQRPPLAPLAFEPWIDDMSQNVRAPPRHATPLRLHSRTAPAACASAGTHSLHSHAAVRHRRART